MDVLAVNGSVHNIEHRCYFLHKQLTVIAL